MTRLFRAAKVFALALCATALWPCSADYPIWSPRSRSADPLYRFVVDHKAGYIDETGKVLIPPKFSPTGNWGGEFHDGLLEIGLSDGAYSDRSGKIVIDKGFYRGWTFSDGLAAAMRKGENLWGYIDTTGAFAISPQFEGAPAGYVSPFSEGLAMIEVRRKSGTSTGPANSSSPSNSWTGAASATEWQRWSPMVPAFTFRMGRAA